jgi:hypothetical protein
MDDPVEDMRLAFVNRRRELAELEAARRAGGLLVVYGRRRVGKTRLLRQWLAARAGLYSQAIEAPVELQVRQVWQDLRPGLKSEVQPRTWEEVFGLLTLTAQGTTLCLDEFPYLVESDPSLPSRLQRWLDHELPKGCLFVVSGSSRRMMHDLFLHRAAPLYGRARKVLRIDPMDYGAFCAAVGLAPREPGSFEKFALVGGIPRYWEFLEPRQDLIALADALYFDPAPFLEEEPARLLRDEGVAGRNALAVLEAVGRGASRPSEIAARMGAQQTSLSRLFTQLLDAALLTRELPFGESLRSSKRVLYRIQDPSLRFWFRVFSPHRSRWAGYQPAAKKALLHEHAASVFEDHCRALYPGSQRYWEADLELDLVAPDPERNGRLLVAEVKWRRVLQKERRALFAQLADTWARSSLSRRHKSVRFAVLDQTAIVA